MKYIYGPLKSRRLGLSLGINLTPYKTCTFDCVYCQLGQTTNKTIERKSYYEPAEILEELRLWLQNNGQDVQKLNFITFSGSGEPALNINIGQLISQIKKSTPVPIAVITNSSLLSDPVVRRELLEADVIVPTLNTASEKVFQKLNQPCAGLKIEDIIQGLIDLRKEFPGKIWLEVMVVKGINVSPAEIRELAKAIDTIKPDKIHLNSPVRAPDESSAPCVSEKKLQKLQKILGDNCEIVGSYFS